MKDLVNISLNFMIIKQSRQDRPSFPVYSDRKFRPSNWAEGLIHWHLLQRPLPKRGPPGPRALLSSWWSEIIWSVGSICQPPCRQKRRGERMRLSLITAIPEACWVQVSGSATGADWASSLMGHGAQWPWEAADFRLTEPGLLGVCGVWTSGSCIKSVLPSIPALCREVPVSVCGCCHVLRPVGRGGLQSAP